MVAEKNKNYWMKETSLRWPVKWEQSKNNFVCPCILFALSIPHHSPQVNSQFDWRLANGDCRLAIGPAECIKVYAPALAFKFIRKLAET